MDSLKDDGKLRALLDELHARSHAQDGALQRHVTETGAKSVAGSEADMLADRCFWRDKLVALDRDKAAFCYRLCRALGARCVVEAGTSYGVSTLYLAAAVRDNGGGVVIGTEYEVEKAKVARRHFTAAGLADQVELREGDLRATLRELPAGIDFMLMDIWIPMVRPAIAAVGPHLRPGAVVIADNTGDYRREYAAYFDYLAVQGYSTQTLPFAGGLEMSVKLG